MKEFYFFVLIIYYRHNSLKFGKVKNLGFIKPFLFLYSRYKRVNLFYDLGFLHKGIKNILLNLPCNLAFSIFLNYCLKQYSEIYLKIPVRLESQKFRKDGTIRKFEAG